MTVLQTEAATSLLTEAEDEIFLEDLPVMVPNDVGYLNLLTAQAAIVVSIDDGIVRIVTDSSQVCT